MLHRDVATGQTSPAGDQTSRWRDSYSRVRKDLLVDNESTNRARLERLGIHLAPRDTPILDVGAGDGNLYSTLIASGFLEVFGLEYQPELAVLHPDPSRLVVASGTDMPFSTASVGSVIVMDVLHHLTPEQIPSCFREIRRVLRPGGILFVCEPSATLFRKILTILLMSPLSGLTQFSRDKRTMVEQELETLEPWLASERSVPSRLEKAGFKAEFFERCWLHHYGRFRAI